MAYLFRHDYKSLIQVDALSQVIGSDYSILSKAELAGQSEVISYLVQKYDVDKEFTDTTLYTYGTTRNAKDRVYLDATTYSATSTYTLNSLTLYSGNVYINISAITTGEAWNAAHWTLLGAQYDMFYAKTPNPDWEYETSYVVGGVIFYNNKNYTALVDNSGLTPSANPSYWGTGTSYTVAGAVLPTDTSKWVEGDNRSAQIVQYLIDVVLYHIHSRIAPRNIPDIRVKRYDDAIAWFKNASKGDWITAAMPKIQPRSGKRIRWGSSLPKQNNNF